MCGWLVGRLCKVECPRRSFVSGAMYALNSSDYRSVLCGTPVIMMFTSDTPFFTCMTHVRSHR